MDISIYSSHKLLYATAQARRRVCKKLFAALEFLRLFIDGKVLRER
jgi:hypothetical protein